MSSFLSLREGLDIQPQKLEAWIILSTLCIAMLLPIYFLMTFWAECLYLAVKTWINFGLDVVALCAGFAIITSFLYLVRKCLGLGEGVIVPIVRACIEVIFTIYGLYKNLREGDENRTQRDKQWDIFANKYLTGFGSTQDGPYQSAVDPQAVEYGPNPVIFAHLYESHRLLPELINMREELEETQSISRGGSGLEANRALVAGREVDDFQNRTVSHKLLLESSSSVHRNGPTTTILELSSFPCSQCSMVFKKAYERNKHINRKHLRRYECSFDGCDNAFSLKTNLDRHKTSRHRSEAREEGLSCPNSWCRSSEKVFTRRDNLERHIRRCLLRSEGR